MPRKFRPTRPKKKTRPLTANQSQWAADNLWRIGPILGRWPVFADSLGYDEAYSIAQEALLYAARQYKAIKSKPGTYITKAILRKLAYHELRQGVIANKGGLPREEMPVVASLEAQRGATDDAPHNLHDVLAAASDDIDPIEQSDDWIKAMGAMKAVLNRRQRLVLTELYIKGRTSVEVAKDMGGITPSRVRQIRDVALQLLRRRLKVKLPA